MSATLTLEGVLFFPVTPLDAQDRVDHDLLREHIESRLPYAPGAVFAACGTGEFHALSATEVSEVVATAVRAVAGRVPVFAGVGGTVGSAVEGARAAADAGADALLVLPPYLVGGTTEGLIAYVERIAAASPLPVVVYHRAAARFTPASVAQLAVNPKVIGFKDGIGDLALAQTIVRAVARVGRDDFHFFNGLLTAELSQTAYRAIGIPLYSSAAFAMAPGVASAYYTAYVSGDEQLRTEILDRFYEPLVALRDEVPGFAVSLVKAGLRLGGLPVGSVRPPLVDPTQEQSERLRVLLEVGDSITQQAAAGSRISA